MTKLNRHWHNRSPVSGLSGNDIYCLKLLELEPGTICMGNSVFSLGLRGSMTSGLKGLGGGEIPEITALIREGRQSSLNRMYEEAMNHGGCGITDVSTEIIRHATNIEFLTVGSTVHQPFSSEEKINFSTSSHAQRLHCQVDAGFTPHHYVFGNVANSIGISGALSGLLNAFGRGEVPEFTEIFDHTRHLALSRITAEAKQYGANAVVGIETTISNIMGAQEMIMIGTASSHPQLAAYHDDPVTSDMTNEELWSMVNMGYLPLRMVMGVSVYSLGVVSGIKAALSALARGELSELTSLLYDAREESIDRMTREAEQWGADQVVGVKTHIYELGGGLIEFMALGTAVKKFDNLTTYNPQLPPQAILTQKTTYFDSSHKSNDLSNAKRDSAVHAQAGLVPLIMAWLVILPLR